MEPQVDNPTPSQVSRPRRRSARQATVHLVAFQVAGREMALRAEEVTEVLQPAALTPMPQTGGPAIGTLNLRGRVVMVFDLRRLLGLRDRPWTRKTRIILAQGPTSPMGFVVDGVSDVVEVPASLLSPPPQAALGMDARAVVGVLRAEAGLVPVLSVASLVGALPSCD